MAKSSLWRMPRQVALGRYAALDVYAWSSELRSGEDRKSTLPYNCTRFTLRTACMALIGSDEDRKRTLQLYSVYPTHGMRVADRV
jgi:hypothetical protein